MTYARISDDREAGHAVILASELVHAQGLHLLILASGESVPEMHACDFHEITGACTWLAYGTSR